MTPGSTPIAEENGPPPDQKEGVADAKASRELKGKTIRGGAYTFGAQAAAFVIQFATLAALARLLSDADFGLVAMVTPLTGLLALFADLGLTVATVQAREISDERLTAVYWLSVAAGIGVAIGVCLISPVVAWFYAEPATQYIALALAGIFVVNGFTAQYLALMQRELRFSDLAIIRTTALVIAGIVAALVGLAGFGYWAIVALSITQYVVTFLIARRMVSWRPSWPPNFRAAGSSISMGGRNSGAQVVGFLRRNFNNVLIGWQYGKAPLGVYANAYKLLLFPIMQFNAPLLAVLVPVLSRLQDDPRRFRKYYCTAMALTCLLGMPAIVSLVLLADKFVPLFLSEKWEGAVPIFQLLGPAALMGTLNIAGAAIFVATGRTDKQLLATLATTPFFILAIVIGLYYGTAGVAAAVSVAFVVCFPLTIAYACHGSPVRFVDLLNSIWRPAFASVLAGVVTYLAAAPTDFMSDPVQLILLALLYAASYGLLFAATLIWKDEFYDDVVNLVTEFKRSRS